MRRFIFSALTLCAAAYADTGFLLNLEAFDASEAPRQLIWDERPSYNGAHIAKIVEEAAKDAGVDAALALSVAKVESDFNPVAVSSSNAIGVMQLKMDTAVRDIYEIVYERSAMPPSEILYDAKENAKLGVAYLRLLQKKYFKEVTDKNKLEYCTIASYNAGPGAVLRTFGSTTEESIRAINRMSTAEVYKKLTVDLQSAEGRRYVIKVLEAKKLYATF